MISMRGLPCILFKRCPLSGISRNPSVCWYRIAFDPKRSYQLSARNNATKTDPEGEKNQAVTRMDPKDTRNQVSTNVMEVVKENTKSAGYLLVIAAGLGVTIYILYSITKELFSNNSPYGIYSRALELCQKNSKIMDSLGEPVKVYGDGRRRRNHFSHGFYVKNGVEHLRLKFYMEGVRRMGTVFVEAKNVSNKYEFTYIRVQLDDVLSSVISIDNFE